MGLGDHTAFALVIIIDINSGGKEVELAVIPWPVQRQPWAVNIRRASPFSSPRADALTSVGQDSEPDEDFSSADLSLRQGSPLPPTRSMINPHQRRRLLSPLTHPFIFPFTLSPYLCPARFVRPFVSHLLHLKAAIDCWFTLLPSHPAIMSVCQWSVWSPSVVLLPPLALFCTPSPRLHLQFFLSQCSLPQSPLIPHYSGSSHFHFSPLSQLCGTRLSLLTHELRWGTKWKKSAQMSLLHFLSLITSPDWKGMCR